MYIKTIHLIYGVSVYCCSRPSCDLYRSVVAS